MERLQTSLHNLQHTLEAKGVGVVSDNEHHFVLPFPWADDILDLINRHLYTFEFLCICMIALFCYIWIRFTTEWGNNIAARYVREILAEQDSDQPTE